MEAVDSCKVGAEQRPRPHILAIPYPLVGHMTPILQLCNILIAKAGCRVTVACSERSMPSLCRLLPEKYEEGGNVKVIRISDGMSVEQAGSMGWDSFRMSLHAFHEVLPRSFAPYIHNFSDVVCVISDVYLSWTQDVANQLGVPRLAVWGSAAAEFQVYFHAKRLMKAGKLPFKAPPGREMEIDNLLSGFPGRLPIYHRVNRVLPDEETITISGLPDLNRRDIPTFLQIEDSSDEVFFMFIEHVKTGLEASMLLFNTFEALDSTLLDVLRSQGLPAHPIGPLLILEDVVMKEQVSDTENGYAKEATGVQDGEGYAECLQWLDGQKPKSVLYVAFGSMLHLSKAQVKELGSGLLNAGQPFIWVYPKPRTEARIRQEFLESFVDEAQGKGLVLEWAPQKRILNHPSIGAFLSHCGWNSTVETISSGVPILCLPFAGDQSLNCKMITDEWKVGLRLERSSVENIAVAEDISQLVHELLVGQKGRQSRERAQELKQAAESSAQPGKSSRATLDAIIKLVKSPS